jgi:hypothetical protein
MNKFEIYNVLKDILSKNGAIPPSENQYNSLFEELIFFIERSLVKE